MHFRLVGPRAMTRVLLVHLDCVVDCVIIYSSSWLLRPCLVQPRCFPSLKIFTHDLLLWHTRLIAPIPCRLFLAPHIWNCPDISGISTISFVSFRLLTCSVLVLFALVLFSFDFSSSLKVSRHKLRIVSVLLASLQRCKSVHFNVALLIQFRPQSEIISALKHY